MSDRQKSTPPPSVREAAEELRKSAEDKLRRMNESFPSYTGPRVQRTEPEATQQQEDPDVETLRRLVRSKGEKWCIETVFRIVREGG